MMLQNYLTIALRGLAQRKGYAFINIFGLAVGMAACLVMIAFVRHEWAYDDFHPEAVYRVDIRAVQPDGTVAGKAGQPLPLAPTLASELPDVEAATRLVSGAATIKTASSDPLEERVVFSDQSFFDVFGFELRAGDGSLRPETAIVTVSAAEKYFGTQDAVGRTLPMSFGGPFETFEIIGVAADPPAASTLPLGVLLPVESWPSYAKMETSWTSWVSNTFVRLRSTAADVREALPAFASTHFAPMIRTWEILQWLKPEEGAFRLELTPMSEIHFHPEVEHVIGDVANATYLYIILGLAVAVLVVACINFAALAVGRSTRRRREVGLRKALGAGRGQLLQQFWGEALVMSVASLLLGALFAEASLPFLNEVLGKRIDMDFLRDPALPLILIALVLTTALGAGAYPALYLSRFRPAEAFRGGASGRAKNRWIEGMVVTQFACSLFCIAAVLVGSAQIRYMKTKHVGFENEQVIVVPTRTTDTSESERMLTVFQSELRSDAAVMGITAASSAFHHDLAWNSFNEGSTGHTVYISRVDPSFLDVLGMSVAAGRGFADELAGDAARGVIVNEALVRDFGLEDPVGRTLHSVAEIDAPRILGVVEDYHFKPMHHQIEPAALFTGSAMPFKYLYVRARPGRAADALAALQRTWHAAAPERPFTYYFLDEDFDRLYRAEDRWQRLIGWAAGLTLLIACMGLFGLAAFATERRTKEIGVRKVLGASVAEVIGLLTRDFVRLVLIAALVGLPAAYIVMNRWLEGYAYRIEAGVGYFLGAAVLGLAIATLTVGFQSARAALSDPAETLRYE